MLVFYKILIFILIWPLNKLYSQIKKKKIEKRGYFNNNVSLHIYCVKKCLKL